MSEAPSLPPGANAEDEGQRAGAAVKPSGQSAKQLKDVDALRAKTEAETKEGAEIAFSKAANVGGDRHNSSRRLTPLAPVNERVGAGEACTGNSQCPDGYFCGEGQRCNRVCAPY